jgi:hypothetical protein
MKVKNINGTSQNTCKCGSWFRHWKEFGGKALTLYCCVSSCSNLVEVGAHVQKYDSTDDRWYIVPFCKEHNAKIGETLDIDDNIELVSANVSETCGD